VLTPRRHRYNQHFIPPLNGGRTVQEDGGIGYIAMSDAFDLADANTGALLIEPTRTYRKH
jgi:hypothetical protein